MSEKRKPDIILVAVKNGKRIRLELFDERQFGREPTSFNGIPYYRVRKNGKWATGKHEWRTITQVTDSLRRYLVKRGRAGAVGNEELD